MVAVDGSERSTKAVTWVLENVVRAESDTLVLVTIEPPIALYSGGAGGAYSIPEETLHKLDEETKSQAVEILRAAEDLCREKLTAFVSKKYQGDARDALCDACKEMKADMLVLGTRGLGPLKRAFLGSVSDYCAKHAPCPVFVVKSS